MHRRRSLACLGAALLGATGTGASAQAPAWPSRPVRLVVGFSAGGALDEMARTLADRLSARIGQAVVVENKPGAASILAAEYVATSPADGHVLFLSGTSTLIGRHLQNRASADISRFTPVSGIAVSPLVIAVNPSFPGRDPESFVREIKAQPGKYFYATAGVGSLHHMGMELLKKQLDLRLEHVPYKGGAAIMPDLLSNQIPIAVISANIASEQSRAGKLRVVGLLSEARWSVEPSWRSMADVARGFNIMPRMFLLAPAGMPPDIVARVDAAMEQVLKSPELLRSFAAQGADAQHSPPSALRAEVARENETWSQVVKALDLKGS
ncbi:MAG TPA: tripartite tricarboxylate transporter substrate binding protein [Ramlibacter sp.]|nr:tripartite tricarboxylate transporter substrate binding protein [Ramlibacter sp.]